MRAARSAHARSGVVWRSPRRRFRSSAFTRRRTSSSGCRSMEWDTAQMVYELAVQRGTTAAPLDASMAKPIVKWAGGKSKLLHELLAHVPSPRVRIYVEPFAGGAALFFALARAGRFERAVLTDRNEELVACYRAVRDDVEALIDALAGYTHDEERYYAERDRDTRGLSDVERAARFIFLNRTCFNGLWRVNSKGKFNVPFGRYKNPRIRDPEGLRAASRALAGAAVEVADFATTVKELAVLDERDFVYFDPPYLPVSETADFTAYASGGFGQAEQERLVDTLGWLRERKVRAMLSNADTKRSRALYAGFRRTTVTMPRSINSDPTKRGDARELLVFNF